MTRLLPAIALVFLIAPLVAQSPATGAWESTAWG